MRDELQKLRALGETAPAVDAGNLDPGEMRQLWERIRGILSMSFENMPRFYPKKNPGVDPAKKETACALRKSAKESVEKLQKKYGASDTAAVLASMQKMEAAAQAVSDLTCRFLEYFEQVKREKNVIDFVDLEHLALKILTEKGEDGVYRPKRAAFGYRQYFDEILIDEYQDSNDVQELLLRIISTEDEEAYNRFMVGDVKQSIYKFRLARPEIFMAKLDSYKKLDPQKERIDLDSNFRSRAQVLNSVNEVFFRLMRKEIGGVEYTDEVSLKTGASYPESDDGDDYKTELLLIAGAEKDDQEEVPDQIKDLSDRQKEALAVSGRIRELVGTLQVKGEDDRLRPCRYGDIVVLLRSGAGWNEDFRDVFERQGIPYYIESKTGYFSASEIQSVLEMLRVLDNPRQDIPLYGVLRGYWGGFGEDEIVRTCTAVCLRAPGRIRKQEHRLLAKNAELSSTLSAAGETRLSICRSGSFSRSSLRSQVMTTGAGRFPAANKEQRICSFFWRRRPPSTLWGLGDSLTLSAISTRSITGMWTTARRISWMRTRT